VFNRKLKYNLSIVPQIVNKRGTEALATTGLDLAPHRKVPFTGVSVQVKTFVPLE
jgi:hypothetical protein